MSMREQHKQNLFSSNSRRQGFYFKIPLLFLCMLTLASAAFAVHTPIVTIDPSTANCDQLGNTFTVTVENSGPVGDDSIYEVRTYEGTVGTGYSCGAPPSGWQVVDCTTENGPPNCQFGYCEYKTTKGGIYMIDPDGGELDFTFDAVMQSAACSSSFEISTLDDAAPGAHEYRFPEVLIDCTAPVVDKTVGNPKIPGQGFDWWITQATNINVAASDNTDTCDLGLDYCRYTYTVDGSSDPGFAEECELDFGGLYEVGWCYFENGGTVDFDFGNCCRERGQKSLLMEEYVCARCETICAAYGIRKSASEIERIGETM